MARTKRLAGVLASVALLGPGLALAQQTQAPPGEVPNPTTGGGSGGLRQEK